MMNARIEPNHIYLMDCREGLRLIPEESVDLIVTDPPFAIEFGARRSNYNRLPNRVLESVWKFAKRRLSE